MKTRFISLAAALLFTASYTTAQADIWLGNCVINVNTDWYYAGDNPVWGSEKGKFEGTDLGAINELQLGGHAETYEGGNNWNSGVVRMYYSISNGPSDFIELKFKEFADNNNKFESGFFYEDQFVFETIPVDISELAPGEYELSVYFWLNDQIQYNNYGNFFKAKFTILPTVTISEDSDVEAILNENLNKPIKLVLANRELYCDGYWNTICLPFNLSSLDGTLFQDAAEIKTLESSSFEDGTLTLNFSQNNVTSIEAGKPYIVKWNSGIIYGAAFNNVIITSTTPQEQSSNDVATFQGCFAPETINGKDFLYLGDENTLYYPDGDVTIGTFRAYFKLNLPEASQVKAFRMNFGDETTAIKQISQPSQLIPYFTLDGRRLTSQPTTAGIYIHNGKKVIIK